MMTKIVDGVVISSAQTNYQSHAFMTVTKYVEDKGHLSSIKVSWQNTAEATFKK